MLKRFELVIGFIAASAMWAVVFVWQSQPAPSDHKWYSTFLEHTPDWFVAIFTGLLAYVTYRLVKTTGDLRASTDKLWEAGERQMELIERNAARQSNDMQLSISVASQAANAAQTSAKAASDSVQFAKDFLERGYVFGGCGGRKLHTDQNGNPTMMEVNASHGNYGKTPVFVEWIFLAQCLEKDLPPKPVYENPIAVNEPLPPTGKWKLVNGAKKIFPALDDQIFYGRFIYLDVFKKRHYSSFIYRFFRNGSHEPVSNIDPEYWAWGEDTNQGQK